MRFASAIRKRRPEVAPPTSYGFRLDAWENAFRVLNDGTEEDRALFILGCLTDHQQGRIKSSMNELGSKIRHRTFSDMSSLFVAEVNQIQLKVFAPWVEILKQDGPVTVDALRVTPCFVDAAANKHAPQSAMEATIDAVGGALTRIWHQKGFGTIEAQADDKVSSDIILAHLLSLAQRWAAIGRIWDAAIWYEASCQVDLHTGAYFVNEGPSDLARRATIDVVRRPALLARDFGDDTQEAKREVMNSVLIPMLCTDATRITVAPVARLPEPLRSMMKSYLVSSASLQELTLIPFLDEMHPSVGIKIVDMLRVWNHLGAIALQFQEAAEQEAQRQNEGGPSLATDSMSSLLGSSVGRENLLEVLSCTLALSHDDVDRCLDFLTFEPAKNRSLWDRPLLSVGNGFSLMWWPLLGIHHARVLSQWAKSAESLEKAFESKGDFNEKILHRALESAIRKGPFRNDARVVGVNLRPDAKPDEEIDLIFVLGDTLFVVETASVPHPAEPFEYWEMEGRLEKKATQCKVRCKILRENPKQIIDWLQRKEVRTPISRVVGLVVTNSYLRDGTFPSEVVFIHWDTLLSILTSGGILFGLMRSDGEQFTLKASCHDGADSAHDEALIAALRCSPKAEFYARATNLAEFRVPRFDRTDVQGLYRSWRYTVPPTDELELYLRACSFGSNLQEEV